MTNLFWYPEQENKVAFSCHRRDGLLVLAGKTIRLTVMLKQIQTLAAKRAALLYLVITNAVPGFWALFLPQAFYSSFPGFGRVWVAVDGPYNQHLIRDVGAMFLVLATLSGFALLKPEQVSTRVVGFCTLVFNVPHLLYHLLHLHMLPFIDQIANLVVLSMGVIVPLLLLFADHNKAPGRSAKERAGRDLLP